MERVHSIVFLVDVDNTLLDNDGVQQDLKDHLERAYGRDARDPKGIHYVDVGTSGGIWGLERGYCMVIGGEAIWVFTHDAMGDGEDGPTHQPVEQLVSMRAIPGLVVLRPADANEVVEAYRVIKQLRHRPAAIVLSRLNRDRYAPRGGGCSRRLRFGRHERRFARDHSHRHRRRGLARRRCARKAEG